MWMSAGADTKMQGRTDMRRRSFCTAGQCEDARRRSFCTAGRLQEAVSSGSGAKARYGFITRSSTDYPVMPCATFDPIDVISPDTAPLRALDFCTRLDT
ncbi:hypothetical protein NDU88_004964 [Pleurodeles waltl]|uniref:Uncharacterized protein n=1 Tax=Pleurodeles waltl TaxID=8319 RepID=A0AAV7PH61_PLEWA|nr:hypothetical protein NDU88_004964 [Pleurodeles waltl]